MGIIINEIKKVFNIKSVIVLLMGLFIIQFLFISFYIEYFPNGSNKYYYDLHVDMLKKYGNTIDDNEIRDFQKLKAEKINEANEYLRSSKDASKLGIDTYEKFANTDIHDEEANKLTNKIMFEENQELFWQLQAMGGLDKEYLERNNRLKASFKDQFGNIDKAIEKRINYLAENNKYNSTMTSMVFYNYNDLLKGFSIAIIFSIVVLLCTIFVGDNSKGINHIQYTSKIGRRIFNKKIALGMILSIFLTTVGIISMLMTYRLNNPGEFLNCNINGPYNFIFWFDMTFKQYIILTIVAMYVVGILTALISMFVSSISRSIVASVVINSIVGVIIIKLTEKMIYRNILIGNNIYMEIGIIALIMIGCILTIIVKSKKETKLVIA